jgi:hypothetical protein
MHLSVELNNTTCSCCLHIALQSCFIIVKYPWKHGFLKLKPHIKEIKGQGHEKMVRIKRNQASCAAVKSFATCTGEGEKEMVDTSFSPIFILSNRFPNKSGVSNFLKRQ